MPQGIGRCALLFMLTCLITGCDGATSKSSTRLDSGSGFGPEVAAFSSPAEALQRAETLRLAGADVEALAVLAAAYRRYPAHAGVMSAYGRLALVMGHDDLAARVLQAAVTANPRDGRALSAQGVLEWRNGRTDEARGALIRAKSASPGDSAVLNNLAVGYLLEDRPAEAVSLLRQALASPPASFVYTERIRRNLAVALAVEGNFAEADRLARTSLPRSLQNADASTIRQFMGLTGAPAGGQSGWEARLADVRQDSPGAR
jgi:Flp pilus assembly protein TadD